MAGASGLVHSELSFDAQLRIRVLEWPRQDRNRIHLFLFSQHARATSFLTFHYTRSAITATVSTVTLSASCAVHLRNNRQPFQARTLKKSDHHGPRPAYCACKNGATGMYYGMPRPSGASGANAASRAQPVTWGRTSASHGSSSPPKAGQRFFKMPDKAPCFSAINGPAAIPARGVRGRGRKSCSGWPIMLAAFARTDDRLSPQRPSSRLPECAESDSQCRPPQTRALRTLPTAIPTALAAWISDHASAPDLAAS